jgi:uncharacterized protein
MRLKYLRNLEDRKSQVIASIAEQEKLTPELELKIKEAQTLVAVEDLYRPYKPKRRTRAMIAKEKGLEPLADLISMQMTAEPVEKAAAGFVSEEKGVARRPYREPGTYWQSVFQITRLSAPISEI